MTERKLNRRKLIASSSAAAAGSLVAATVAGQQPRVLFQEEATPDDTAVDQAADPEATPEGIEPGETIPPEIADAADTDWPVEGRNLGHNRSVEGSSIASDTVNNLEVAWTFDDVEAGPFGALVSNPIVSGDTLFLQDALSNVYAMNRETGEELWRNMYSESVPSGGPNGVGLGYGAVVYPVGRGGVVAADMETGEELWHVDITGPRGEGITVAPIVHNNRVYISTVPGDPDEFYQGGMRGLFHVLDMADGSVLWYFDTTTDNLWGNPAVNSGGGIWRPPAVDENGDIYVGIGNAAPHPGTEEWPSGASRPGDNAYANNLLKIDAETGGLVWSIDITGRNNVNYDNQASPMLATVDVKGHPTPMVFTSGKHGFVVAADPTTGGQIWRTPVGTHRNNPIPDLEEGEEVEVWPGTGGGVRSPLAIQDNVVYAVPEERPTLSSATTNEYESGYEDATGVIVALDAANGSILWETEILSLAAGGATVVNDLIFTGSLDGIVRAYSTEDGSLVWSDQTTGGLNAPFAVSGDYLYIPAGSPMYESEDTEDPDQEFVPQLIAYHLG